MSQKQRLELTWVGKYDQPNLEPRILIEDPSKSYGDKRTENMLIYGDNLLALKALEQDFTGKIKCIFIDPPYNTGSAFELYDDSVEHSIWLSLMKPRLEILRNLLSDDGSLYVSIDFNETHYLKVLLDEIFGRGCFQREIIWRMGWLSGFKTGAKNYIRNHDTVLFYTKEPNSYYFNKEKAYTRREDYVERYNSAQIKEILTELEKLNVSKDDAQNFVDFISTIGLPERYPMEDTWNCGQYDKLNSINVVSFSGEKVSKMLGVAELKGQKSEALIKRIIDISTEPGDFVLDSFLGTGTTAAVAHKMHRKWIGIELRDHANTHCRPRLVKVVEGADNAGITKAVNWKGGGGFKYYELAPSLLRKDSFENWVIDERYKPDMLAAAMAKHEGFKYCPNQTIYWKQGQSTERDFIYTTTNFVTVEMLDKIYNEMKHPESLLICCRSFSKACDGRHPNITVKKIPNMLLGRCEFGKNDYSLNIVTMPVNDDEPDFIPSGPEEVKGKMKSEKKGQGKSGAETQSDLFTKERRK